jgi:DNA-binding SARP family transcriptional activator
MTPTTIVLFDHNTQQVAHFLNLLEGHFDILSVRFNSLPEVRKNQITAFFILCMRPDDVVYEKVADLNLRFSHIPIVLFSPAPQPEEVTFAVAQGVKGYFKLDTDEKPLLTWLNTLNPFQPKYSIWGWLKSKLHKFLKPTQHKGFSKMAIAQNNILPLAEIENIVQKMPIFSEEAPQYFDLLQGNLEQNQEKMFEKVIKVRFFGNFEVEIGHQILNIKNGSLLLAYLLFNHSKPIHKQRIIDRFWPDSTHDAARNCLNSTIFALRRAFNEVAPNQSTIMFQNEHYAIHPDWRVETDADAFQGHWRNARDIERTQGLKAAMPHFTALIALHKDDFLVNFPNIEWALGERDTFRERYLQVLQHVADFNLNDKNYVAAIEYYQEILKTDDCLEEIHCKLMTCYTALKMKDRAMRQYKRCVDTLKKVQLSPSRETYEWQERIGAL